MTTFIYTMAIEVNAIDQDEATWLIYNTPLEKLNTYCLDIEEEE
jgi:hypothetical protein